MPPCYPTSGLRGHHGSPESTALRPPQPLSLPVRLRHDVADVTVPECYDDVYGTRYSANGILPG